MAFDPLFAQVVFLSGWEGADGSFPSPEESSFARALNYSGNAQADTAIKKFGVSSLRVDGLGDFTNVPQSNELTLGNKDFTIETFVRFNTIDSAFNTFVSNYDATGDDRSYYFAQNGGLSELTFNYFTPTGVAGDLVGVTGSFSPSTATQIHVAVSRNSGTIYLHAAGAEVGNDGGAVGTTTIFDSLGEVTKFGILDIGTTGLLDGHMDETRITIGTARYGAGSIIVPTEAFPRVGPPVSTKRTIICSM